MVSSEKTCVYLPANQILQPVQNFCIFAALDLTLVDLPGLVKNPTHDQDDDIEEQVKFCEL